MIRRTNFLAVRTFILTVVLLAGSTSLARCDEPSDGAKIVNAQPAEPFDQKLEPEKLVADFRMARGALEEGHSGIYRSTSKEELDRIFDEAQKSLDKPLSVLEFYRVIVPVVAAIKCGHTGVALPSG